MSVWHWVAIYVPDGIWNFTRYRSAKPLQLPMVRRLLERYPQLHHYVCRDTTGRTDP
jgi:hypothetical protein